MCVAEAPATRYGFYEYEPQEPLVLEELVRLIEAAKRQVGAIDIVVLPEGAVEEETVAPLQQMVAAAGVPYLIAGARQPPESDSPLEGSLSRPSGDRTRSRRACCRAHRSSATDAAY